MYNIYNAIVSLAVPFFFISTGFFVGKKLVGCSISNGEKAAIIKRKSQEFIRLYLIWNVIYLPITVLYWVKNGASFLEIAYNIISGLFIVGQQYNSWMLWYLPASIYWLYIIRFMIKRNIPTRIMLIATIGMFLIGTLQDALVDNMNLFSGISLLMIKMIKVVLREGRIFTAGVYLLVGMLFAKHENRSNILTCFALFVLGFAGKALCIEGALADICVLIASVALYPMLLRINLKDAGVYSIFRRMSTVVYFVHLFIWTVLYSIIYGEKHLVYLYS